MYNARSRVVHRTHAQQQLVWCCQGRRPAFPGPAPVRHHRIHQGGDDHGVHGVCLELEALRDRTRDNGGACGRKGEGVEPLGVLVSLHVERIYVVNIIPCENLRAERKVARADEFALPAVQKGKAEEEKRDRTAAHVEQILEERVFGVANRDCASEGGRVDGEGEGGEKREQRRCMFVGRRGEQGDGAARERDSPEPTSSRANPVCMKKTMVAPYIRKNTSYGSCDVDEGTR